MPCPIPVPASPNPSKTAPDEGTEPRRLGTILLLLAALVGLPLAVLLGFAQVDLPWSSRRAAPPQWVALPVLRATTGDGTVVRSRVAVDGADGAARRLIEQRPQQIALLLESTFTARERREITTEAGLQQLGTDLRDRLNGYLADAGVAPVKRLIVQDLLFGSP